MGELGRGDGPADRDPEGDRPEQRPDRIPKPDPPKSADAYYNVDRRKLTPVQRDYVRTYADNPPEARPGGIPAAIDWKTGKSVDGPVPVDDVPDDVRGVHDPLDETRPRDKTGGLAYWDPRDQWTLENAVPKDAEGKPEKFPDPEGEWTEYVNDGGPEVDHFRANNCLDCSLAALATWYGHPTVSAPRFPDITPQERLDPYSGERRGPDRAEAWTEGQYEAFGTGDPGLAAIEKQLREGGHGSAAVIITSWSMGPGSHAWNAFNHEGKIIWYDPQMSITSDRPVYQGRVRRVAAMCLDSEGKQL